jgi:RNA polymerase sigma factor (sigma-70 family)
VDTRRAIVDGLLVLAARGGDVEAFERLAARWHPRLLRHARRLTGDAGGASDATQDAWVAIVAGLRRLRDPSTFGPWALRITTRRCADWIARRRSARTRDTAIDPSRPAPGPAGSMDDVMRLREALRQLGREERLLLTML